MFRILTSNVLKYKITLLNYPIVQPVYIEAVPKTDFPNSNYSNEKLRAKNENYGEYRDSISFTSRKRLSYNCFAITKCLSKN